MSRTNSNKLIYKYIFIFFYKFGIAISVSK